MQVFLDDFNLNDQRQGMHLDEPIEGLSGMPELRTAQGVNAGRHGGWTSKQLYDARFISFNGRIFGNTIEQTEQRRRDFASKIADVVRRGGATLKVITPGGMIFTTDIAILGLEMPIPRNLNTITWKLNLKADDPLLYDNSEGELLAIVRKVKPGGFTIPFTFPLHIGAGSEPTVVVNAGNEPVLPIIRIKTTATNPQLVNRTTGKEMRVDVTVEAGSVLDIDMKHRTIVLDGANVYHAKSEQSEFWELQPGNNQIELVTSVGSEDTTAEVRYRSGFIGI